MRRLIGLILAALLAACEGDKQPRDFGELDLDIGAGGGTGDEVGEDETPTDCVDHDDCFDDQLCFESECLDREAALDDCDEDDDCPDGFVCVDADRCEEE